MNFTIEVNMYGNDYRGLKSHGPFAVRKNQHAQYAFAGTFDECVEWIRREITNMIQTTNYRNSRVLENL